MKILAVSLDSGLTFALWSRTTHMPMIENVISISIEPHQVSTLPFERSEFIKASSDSNQKKKQLHYLKIIYFIRDKFKHALRDRLRLQSKWPFT